MKIINPLKMNDWEISRFLGVIFTIQVLVLVSLTMNTWGLHVPILSEIITLIYLLYVPGILVLRFMKIHEISSEEVLLYSVGLSIVSIMFIGFFINLLYPLMGISNPISLLPLIFTISIYAMILSFLSYLRDRDFSKPDFINSETLLSPYTLFLILIPFVTIYGTYLMNTYKINILIMAVLVMISLTVLLFAYRKIPSKLYPLTIFILSISLLFQTSLISNYITGWDIQSEYYMANFVMGNAFWDLNLSSVLNTTLSIIMLAPIISIISQINLDLIFKLVYPFLFSLVPLGLYSIFRKQTNNQIAFLSSFFFISFFVFFTEMLALGRQEIAELFLVLLVMVMITSEFRNITRTILFIIFSISLILSHYGLSYIYMFSFTVVYLLILLHERHDLRNLYDTILNQVTVFIKDKGLERLKIQGLISAFKDETDAKNGEYPRPYKILSFNFILIFIVFAFAWFMFTSSSSSFLVFVKLGNNIVSSITTEFLNPNSVQSLSIIQSASTPIHSLFRYITYLTQFLIVVGVFSILLKDRMKIKREYLTFILVNVLILIGAVTVPHLSNAFNAERLYQITLIFLAPACIIGGLTVIRVFEDKFLRKLKISNMNLRSKSIPILSLFLVIYFLFNSGLIYYLADDDSTSLGLNTTFDTANYNLMEVQSADWLSNYGIGVSVYGQNSQTGVVISDEYREPLILKYGLSAVLFSFYYDPDFDTMNEIIKGSNFNKTNFYFFLGTKNTLTNSIVTFDSESYITGAGTYRDIDNFKLSTIYDSNGAKILYKHY